MNTLIGIDFFVFIIGFIVSTLFLVKRFYKNWPLLLLGIFYIIGTLSSYNIMIKPIHDFNIVIARNFFYHYELVGPLSVLDILILLCLGIATFILLIKPTKILTKEFSIIILRDIIIGVISFSIFLYLKSSMNTEFQTELMWLRGVPYYLIFFILITYSLRQNKNHYNFSYVFITFLIIDVINILSGLYSTFIYQDYVWQRYGMNVSIIDQDDANTIVIFYSLLFLAVSFIRRKDFFSAWEYFLFFLFFILGIINFYKTIYALIFLFLIFLVFFLYSFHLKKRFFILVTFLFVFSLPFLNIFSYFSGSTPIETRLLQLKDFTDYTLELGTEYLFVGIGNGTYYPHSSREEDKGEKKQIDIDEKSGFAKNLQTPFISIIKPAGIIGIFIFTFLSIISILLIFKKFLCINPFLVAFVFFISYKFISGTFILDPSAVFSFSFAKLLLLSLLLRNEVTTQIYSQNRVLER